MIFVGVVWLFGVRAKWFIESGQFCVADACFWSLDGRKFVGETVFRLTFGEIAEVGEFVQCSLDGAAVTVSVVGNIAHSELVTTIGLRGTGNRLRVLRERLDNRAVADHWETFCERRRVSEHDRAFLIAPEAENGLQRLVVAHMPKERVGRRAIVIKRITVA
jgi:hypothetical protein